MTFISENRLIKDCARTKLNDSSVSRVKEILDTDVNWEYVVRNAVWHSVESLLYKNLMAMNNNCAIPDQVIKALRMRYLLNRGRNTQLYKNLFRVLRIFKNEGIEVVLLKGAVLAEDIYRNIGLRPFGDIDIYVPFPKIKNNRAAETVINIDDENDWLDVHYAGLRGRDMLIQSVDNNEIWERAVPFTISGMETRKLSPEHQLLHLILHGDYFIRLIWLCDIAETVRYYGESMNWQIVVDNAWRYGYNNLYFFQLSSARQMLNAPVPDEALKQLRPNRIKRFFTKRLIQEWEPQSPKTKFLNLAKPLQVHLLEFLTIARYKHKLNKIRGVFIPDLSWVKEHYSASTKKKLYFYYIINCIIVPLKVIKAMLNLFRRKKNI